MSSVQRKLMHWNTFIAWTFKKKIFFCILQKKEIFFLIRFYIWYFQCCLNVYLCVKVIAPHHHQWHSCICNTITFPSYRTRHLNCSCDERSLDSVFPFSLLHLSMSTHDSKAKRSARGKAKHTPVFDSTRFHNCSHVDATVVSGHTLDHSCAGWMITSSLRPLLNSRLHWDQTQRPVFVTHALYLTFTEQLLFL